LSDGELIKGEEYIFDFNFKNEVVETYKGINTSFLIKLELYVERKGNQFTNKPTSIIEKLTNKLSFNNRYSESWYLDYRKKENGLQIISKEDELELKANFTIQFLMLVILGLIFFILPEGQKSIYIITVFILAVLTILGSYFLMNALIGTINIKYEHLENNKFSFKLSNNKKWSYIKKLTPSFEVCEEVLDKRGTSDSLIISVINTGTSTVKLNPINEETFVFNFPAKNITTVTVGDARVYWVAKVKAMLILGFNVNLETEFKVQRKLEG